MRKRHIGISRNDEVWMAKYNQYLTSTKKSRQLTDWASRMRVKYAQQYNKSKYSRQYVPLSPKQIRLLEAIPDWHWGRKKKDVWYDVWYKNHHAFKNFVRVNKRIPKQNESPHYNWMINQRKKRRKRVLSQEQIKLLSTINGLFRTPKKHKPINKPVHKPVDYVKRAIEFLKKFNKLPVNKYYDIYAWASSIRSRYKHHSLARKTIRLLNAVPGWTWNLSK
jgi:hypothetical protein